MKRSLRNVWKYLLLRNNRRRRKEAGLVIPPSPLLTDLVAHWKLEETAEGTGFRYDSVGPQYLSPHGVVAQVEGKFTIGPYAAQFVPDTNDYLSCISSAALRMGAVDFTIAGWVEFDAVSPTGLIGKWDNGSFEYLVGCDGNYLSFSASADGLTPVTIYDINGLEGGTWYHFCAWHDSVQQTLNLIVNNDYFHSYPPVSFEGGVFAGNADINLGRDAQAGNYFAGRLQSVSIWKRLLSNAEQSSLYNNGYGLAYPFQI